ncbi:MAG: chemotaxis protein CheA [Planctomycetaceae bacterium]
METMDEIVKEFLVESYDNLDQLDRDLVALEDAPDDRGRLSSIFRTIHTIKGTCGFLGFPMLEHVTHVGESLLVRLRDGELKLNATITTALLAMVDAVRSILAMIEVSGTEGDDNYAELVATLDRLKHGEAVTVPPEETSDPGWQKMLDKQVFGAESPAERKTRSRRRKRASNAESKSSTDTHGELADVTSVVADLSHQGSSTTKKRRKRGVGGNSSIGGSDSVACDVRPSLSGSDGGRAVSGDRLEAEQGNLGTDSSGKNDYLISLSNPGPNDSVTSMDSSEKSHALSETTVRLDVALLDRLMNLVGELVLARNQILQYSRHSDDAVIIAASQRLNLITAELQEGIMKTRMQPIQNAWSRLPRVVRDLSASLGKKVQIKMDGADTELDKTILEAIKDPLTHIVRNSVDHGIETPAVREAAGKQGEGTLSLRAFHEGGQVIIEIGDDGAGIDLVRVKEKALSQGLITAEQALGMSDRDLTRLILLPGFSTAAQVTNVSGRGVGMDVVKTNVEKIGGTLEIHSVLGAGTTMRIKIPLTLAIVPGLTVTCDGDCFCIPQASLLELVRLEGDQVEREIEQIHNVPVYRLRGNLLPLLYLDEQLGLRAHRTDKERRSESEVNIVVLQAEGKPFGLVVDSITDMQEIVVKPLGLHLKGILAYAGATIMGDGRVSLILDVAGIARLAQVLDEQRDLLKSETNASADQLATEPNSWLIVDPGDGTRAAIALGTIARLEEFRIKDIERFDATDVIQYRGQIMPLMRLVHASSTYGSDHEDFEQAGQIPVIVYQCGELQVGVVVGEIVDIVEHALDKSASCQNRLDAQIICGRVTRVVDLGELVRVAV